MKDASIDDFLDGGGRDGGGEERDVNARAVDGEEADEHSVTDDEGAAAGESDEATERGDSTDPDSIDPAVSTYAWSPDGAACADCGTTVERRWRDGDRLVCADCKVW